MRTDNKNVNGLWIGRQLSDIELLTINSFLHHGHTFTIWTYEDIDNVPNQVIVKDANEIIGKDKVFKYPEDSKLKWGKGSYAGFSDIFRYKLLYEKGGWWVDMDLTCLKPFDFEDEYFFRSHWKYKVVGNAMKCPKGSRLMLDCYNQSREEVRADNLNWHKPIEILNQHIRKLNLLKYRHRGLFNNDHAFLLRKFLKRDSKIPEKWYGIHWCNSSGKLNYAANSSLYQLMKTHNRHYSE